MTHTKPLPNPTRDLRREKLIAEVNASPAGRKLAEVIAGILAPPKPAAPKPQPPPRLRTFANPKQRQPRVIPDSTPAGEVQGSLTRFPNPKARR